jgi:uncharacterized protein YecE (DUF72 family)
VYCYFDNDVKVHAPYDAARLARLLDVSITFDGRRPSGADDLPAPRMQAPAFRSR